MVVHGKTIIESVEKGTYLAVLNGPRVDIFTHPGLLSLKEAKLKLPLAINS